MSAARRVLIFGGIALAALGMLYGLHYAVFVEHQTLDQMGGSLGEAFIHAAERQLPESKAAIGVYAATKYNYVRQVDVHSHWIGLGMLMIILGMGFDEAGLKESIRLVVAWALLAGAFVFPLGVQLQTSAHGSKFALALAVAGSALVIAALGTVVIGFARAKY